MKLDAFRLEDVRCFAGPQTVRIRPLTFLVGENSTGKSTVLGCMQAVADYMADTDMEVDLNRHPYEMGSFREVVRRSRPLVQSFKLGVEWRGDDEGEVASYTLELHEREGGARATVREAVWRLPDVEFRMRLGRSGRLSSRRFTRGRTGDDGLSLVFDVPQSWFYQFQAHPWRWSFMLDSRVRGAKPVNRAVRSVVAKYANQFRSLQFGLSPARSIAPVRSKPERTYNPFSDVPDPEGSDVPADLAGIARRGGRKWDDLKAGLERFGRESGLFSELAVRRLGKSGSDPFQLQVRARGPRANIKDVGYGVSQILPILVRLVHPTERAATFLVQQPEVHLHPRGQAALSSIMIGLLDSNSEHRRGLPLRFVIETHSDYMIDRARIAIRRKEISSDDVSLVYFEAKSRGGVVVHNICFDEMGNMAGAPAGYRDFFLKESDALLGFGE